MALSSNSMPAYDILLPVKSIEENSPKRALVIIITTTAK